MVASPSLAIRSASDRAISTANPYRLMVRKGGTEVDPLNDGAGDPAGIVLCVARSRILRRTFLRAHLGPAPSGRSRRLEPGSPRNEGSNNVMAIHSGTPTEQIADVVHKSSVMRHANVSDTEEVFH